MNEPLHEPSIGSSGVAKFLVSRFNLYIQSFRKMSNIDELSYDDWCRRRVELFQKYTLPSVVSQHYSHFDWLIYFDTELNSHIEKLLKSMNEYKYIHPILLDLRGKNVGDYFVAQIQQDMMRIMPIGAAYACTTRLDTDDALGNAFFNALEHQLHRMKISTWGDDRYAVTFPFGCQLMGKLANVYIYERNPFITLIEKLPASGAASPPMSVFGFPHYDVERVASLYRALTTTPQWLQVIHEGNAANQFKHDLPRLVDGQISKWFSLS